MLCTNLPGSHLCCIVASCTGQCDMLIASISHLCCIFSSSFSVALQYKFYANFTCVVFQVKELQKATRIIQALCSEAKGQKRMPVACKVPAVKRSMEKFVFCVKALLHGASHGNSFWMGKF
jgi:hypothetical protein